jgi:hypothetical protein
MRGWLEDPSQEIKVQSSKSKCQMSVKFQKGILKSKTLNWFRGKVQNDILIMPNLFQHLIWALNLICY